MDLVSVPAHARRVAGFFHLSASSRLCRAGQLVIPAHPRSRAIIADKRLLMIHTGGTLIMIRW
jgi:hypothetical protein